jgi:uncharacterized protein with von Willebrand factor type A (vWA) domain
MQGEKVQTAKALALAVAWVARRQQRWCGLVAFSGSSGERLLPLPPHRWDEEGLAGWLTEFLGRGSECDVPVAELPRMYQQLGAPHGRTDVVMVTDALARIEHAVRESFTAWKRAVQARVLTLVVGGASPGDLAHVSDELFAVPALSATDDAVGRVLSL